MKKITKFFIPTLLITVFSVFGFAYGFSISEDSKVSLASDNINSTVINVSGTWGDEPQSVEELKAKSDLVVIGEVGNKEEYISPYAFDENEVFTNVDFKPLITIKGEEEETLDIAFYGGITNSGKEVIWENIMKLEEGKTYLLFLRRHENIDSPLHGKYTSIDGPAGAYAVEMKNNNNVKSIDNYAELTESNEIEFTVQNYVSNIQYEVSNLSLDELINN